MTLEGEVNKFLFRHPVIGALTLVGGLTALLVFGGMAYDYAPQIVGAICIAVLVLVALAGNRHFS
jgi:hypothetical protein